MCNYSDLAALFSYLLKKECNWQWTEWEQSAFEGLNSALTTASVLVYPFLTRPFSYATDASDIVVRTAL